MKSEHRICLLFLALLANLGLPLEQAFAQLVPPPEEYTIQAGQKAFINFWPAGSQSNNVFVGDCCQKTTPYEGGQIFTGERGLDFFSQPLFETTKFFFETCGVTACGFTHTITVIVQQPGPPDALEGATDEGDKWWFSDWFGFFNTEFATGGWIFHAQHGWMFLFADSTPESAFLFDLASDAWHWTNATTYPNFYNFGRNSWVFYFAGTSGPREFVDLVSGEFFSLD